MERKLASIQQIRKLVAIPNADFIEIAWINDWTVIVKKGEFTKGSLAVFFEIDSLLPDEPRFAFLEKSKKEYNGINKYRLKTMKMRGVISQGLALPMSTFPEVIHPSVGDDVTDLLSIIKYEAQYADPMARAKAGNAQGKFPSFIPKTDQERIQNLPHYYELYKDHEWEETLKLDGSSLTCYKIAKEPSLLDKILSFFGRKQKAYHFGVCSRNLELKRSDNFKKTFDNDGKLSEYNQSDFWKIVNELNIEKHLPVGYALQGELIGPKIQANHEKVDRNHLYIFDVFDIVNQRYLLPLERQEFFSTYLPSTIKHVPVVNHSVKIFTECPDLDSLQVRVTGESINPKTVSEGRVLKSCTIPGLSFKCISNQYLLKCED